MNVNLKYKFGDEVYVVYKENDGLIRVLKSVIEEFSMSEKYGLHYYVKDIIAEEIKEEELVPIDRKDLLAERIDKLLGEEDE